MARTVHIFDVGDYEGEIASAARVMEAGGLVLLPTETSYGLAGLLTHAGARGKLRAVKTTSSPFVPHLSDAKQAEGITGELPPFARKLTAKFWPGPVGIAFPVVAATRDSSAAALGLDAGDLFDAGGEVTLRVPDHPVARDVAARLSGPMAVVAAATTTAGPAFRPADLAPPALDAAELLLDAGASRYNRPSTLVRFLPPDQYEVTRVGVYERRILDRMLKTTLLFVCSGNTCRSPMAMALARRQIAETLGVPEDKLEAGGVSVLSAGTFAMGGGRATPQAVQAASDLGADLSRHRSRPLTVELIQQADRIYTMGRSHRAAVLSLVPSAAEKTQTLDPAGDIEDPIGSDVTVYRSLAHDLDRLIRARLAETPIV